MERLKFVEHVIVKNINNESVPFGTCTNCKYNYMSRTNSKYMKTRYMSICGNKDICIIKATNRNKLNFYPEKYVIATGYKDSNYIHVLTIIHKTNCDSVRLITQLYERNLF